MDSIEKGRAGFPSQSLKLKFDLGYLRTGAPTLTTPLQQELNSIELIHRRAFCGFRQEGPGDGGVPANSYLEGMSR